MAEGLHRAAGERADSRRTRLSRVDCRAQAVSRGGPCSSAVVMSI
ncbi:hypothetical protein [Lysobacter gummosus]